MSEGGFKYWILVSKIKIGGGGTKKRWLIVIEEFADYIDDENKFMNNKPEINKQMFCLPQVKLEKVGILKKIAFQRATNDELL